MEPQKSNFTAIDDYISALPEDKQKLLEQVRATIHAAAPDAEEVISYQMPAFAQNGVLVWFSALKNHIGFYATGSPFDTFSAEIAPYKSTKSSLNFPIDQPLPLDLISKIVKFRLAENINKAEAKASKKKSAAASVAAK